MYRRWFKRGLDLLLSAVAMLVLSPLLGLVAIAIWIEDGLPVMYRQQRVGRGGGPFTLFKFRSMPVGTTVVASAQAQGLRVTKVGATIRRTNVDELPQLWNIFRGEMSVVGPRPALPSQAELCALRRQKGVLAERPGLTGLAQINSYDGMSDSEKAEWDSRYCRRITLLGDMLIVLRTFLYLLKPPPRY